MNETRARRYSYNSNLPKQHPPLKNQSPHQVQNVANHSEELRKNYELIENLKAEVELEKQGRQYLEEQSKYLSKKVQTYK